MQGYARGARASGCASAIASIFAQLKIESAFVSILLGDAGRGNFKRMRDVNTRAVLNTYCLLFVKSTLFYTPRQKYFAPNQLSAKWFSFKSRVMFVCVLNRKIDCRGCKRE